MTPICSGLEETIADCTEAIRVDPHSPQLYLERAGARARLDRYQEAVADYDRAIGLDPDHAAAYLGRCHAKSELGRHEEAIDDYDRAVHLDPASASASGGSVARPARVSAARPEPAQNRTKPARNHGGELSKIRWRDSATKPARTTLDGNLSLAGCRVRRGKRETLRLLRTRPAERAGTTRDPVVDLVGPPRDRPLAKLDRQRECPAPHLAIDARPAQSG